MVEYRKKNLNEENQRVVDLGGSGIVATRVQEHFPDFFWKERTVVGLDVWQRWVRFGFFEN
jgi:methylase of polypeptide subunit release factors